MSAVFASRNPTDRRLTHVAIHVMKPARRLNLLTEMAAISCLLAVKTAIANARSFKWQLANGPSSRVATRTIAFRPDTHRYCLPLHSRRNSFAFR